MKMMKKIEFEFLFFIGKFLYINFSGGEAKRQKLLCFRESVFNGFSFLLGDFLENRVIFAFLPPPFFPFFNLIYI